MASPRKAPIISRLDREQTRRARAIDDARQMAGMGPLKLGASAKTKRGEVVQATEVKRDRQRGPKRIERSSSYE